MEEAYPGQFACLMIKSKNTEQKLQRKDFRKGMFLIEPSIKPESSWYFEAEILVLHHSTTVKAGY
jgi:GTPase